MIEQEMYQILNKEAIEDKTNSEKIVLALDILNQASEVLENLGKNQHSEVIIKLMEHLSAIS